MPRVVLVANAKAATNVAVSTCSVGSPDGGFVDRPTLVTAACTVRDPLGLQDLEDVAASDAPSARFLWSSGMFAHQSCLCVRQLRLTVCERGSQNTVSDDGPSQLTDVRAAMCG